MKKQTTKVEDFVALEPRRFSSLKSLGLSRNFDETGVSPYTISLTMTDEINFSRELKITFKDAFGIKIGAVEGVGGLRIDIENIRDHQIEGGVYRVNEEELLSFSFFCRDFHFEIT